MKGSRTRLMRRFARDQRGQSAVVVVVALFAVMALSAAGVETGHVYYAYRLLQASTQSATLAGAQAMPNITQASTNVNNYSVNTGAENYTSLLSFTSITPTYTCGSVASSLNVNCQVPTSGSCSGSASNCNTITVTQKAAVNLWLGGLVGIRTFNLAATSIASMRGGTAIPYNIAVIIDTTASMTATAPSGDGCGTNASQIQCAVYGLRTMLGVLDPCALNTTCSATTPYVDGVALYVFPALSNTAANLKKDTVCNTSDPSIDPYTFPVVTTGSGQNLVLPSSGTIAATYEVSESGTGNTGTTGLDTYGFDDMYRANDLAATPVNSTDAIGVAAGAGSCQGLQAPGGEGTYYAQVVRAAQAQLVAQQANYPGSKNIMIILSDGNANACNSQADTSGGAGGNTCSASQLVAENCPQVNSYNSTTKVYTCGSTTVSENNGTATLNCPSGGCTGSPLNGTGTAATNPSGYNVATYPSALGQCGQAVQAAQAATAAGTTVYTVAMGSPTTGGCLTDQNGFTLTGLSNGAATWPTGGSYPGQPCNAIGAMASNVNTFFSDNQPAKGSSNGCAATGGNVNYTTMAQIFTAIGNNLTSARLIP
jgi:Flp pilus assembly protein TadG